MKKLMTRLYVFMKKVWKWVITELKDVRTFIIFALVWLILSSPAWGGYLLTYITKNGWHATYATAYLVFWMGPFTPFLPLCLAITIGIKKLLKIKAKRKINKSVSCDKQIADNVADKNL